MPIQPEIQLGPSDLEKAIGNILLLLVMVGLFVVSYILFKDRFKNKEWKKGIFPSKLPFTTSNLIKAYICLSANMIRRDVRDTSLKVRFVVSFVNKEFTKPSFDVNWVMKFALKFPIQVDTVCDWINDKIETSEEKMKLISLMLEVAMKDGALVANELWLLRELMRLLKLEQKELDALLSRYVKHELSAEPINLTKLDICFSVIGIDENASIREIKKAYRRLVMIHHPDKFDAKNEEQQFSAQKRFLIIQEAYEYLMSVKK